MKTAAVAFILGFFAIADAQPLLTIDSAIAIALKNNYDIRIASSSAEIARVNNTAGNAGMLPTLSASASDNFGYNSVDQKLSSGRDTAWSGVTANSAVAAVTLNWTLFDGGKMFVTRSKLAEIERLGRLQFRDRVLQTVYSVTAAYYEVVRQKRLLASINEVAAYNEERVRVMQTGFNAGLTIKTNLLQAKLDLNVNKESIITQRSTINSAKRGLNRFLSRGPGTDFDVPDSIPIDNPPDKAALAQKIMANNISLLALRKQVEIAQLSVREFKKLALPRITLSTGYQFLRADNSAGSVLMNRSSGPQIGGTVTIPLYQGDVVKRQVATARLQVQMAGFALENAQVQVNMALQDAVEELENQDQLLAIEKENSVLAKENLEISMQRLRLGQATTLEVHLAQETYAASLTRLISIQYAAKLAEARLKQLAAGE